MSISSFFAGAFLVSLIILMPIRSQASPESGRLLRNGIHFYEERNYDKAKAYFTKLLSEGSPHEQKTARHYLSLPEFRRTTQSSKLTGQQRAALALQKGKNLYRQKRYEDAAKYFNGVLAVGNSTQRELARSYLDLPEMESGREGMLDEPVPPTEESSDRAAPVQLSGYLRNETAYRVNKPRDFSLCRTVGFVSGTGKMSDVFSYKISGRAYYDAVFSITDQYPRAVRDDQKAEATLRDTYIDISKGDWDARVGKQQIIWGEAIGFFYADVVNARDLRESVLPAYDFIRIPQWGTNLEYSKKDFHFEAIWLPFLEFNKLPRPGAEFSTPLPEVPGYAFQIAPEDRPVDSLQNSEIGGRASYRAGGWDVSLFVDKTWDKSPIYVRDIQPGLITLTPTHRRITYSGMTFTKEIEGLVWKGELVYTNGKYLPSRDPTLPEGLLRKNVIEYLLGVDHTLAHDIDVNAQVSQRLIRAYQSDLINEKATRTSISLGIQRAFFKARFLPRLQAITDLPYKDYLLRPSLGYRVGTHWRLALGGDFFGGPLDGPFGQFSGKSRLYSEIRYDF